TLATRRFVVTVPRDAERSQPYFLKRPLAGALYDWSAVPPELRGLPFEPPALELRVRLAVAGAVIGLTREVSNRYRDEANGDVRRCDGALGIIDYPHIRPRPVVRPSTVEIRVARILLPPLTRVGYVRGPADREPEALAAVGVPIDLLGADSLARGNLSRYEAIVIGG